jgi:hypothetical protein
MPGPNTQAIQAVSLKRGQKRARDVPYDFTADSTFEAAARKRGKVSREGATAASIRGQGGLHEVVPTNTQLSLLTAKRTGSNKVRINSAEITTNAELLSATLDAADSARTSTKITLLSLPGGGVAGHSGSPFSTKGQKRAHDVVRDAIPEPIDTSKPNPGQTPESIAVFISALAVAQRAPAQIASKPKVKYADRLNDLKIKAHMSNWEGHGNDQINGSSTIQFTEAGRSKIRCQTSWARVRNIRRRP